VFVVILIELLVWIIALALVVRLGLWVLRKLLKPVLAGLMALAAAGGLGIAASHAASAWGWGDADIFGTLVGLSSFCAFALFGFRRRRRSGKEESPEQPSVPPERDPALTQAWNSALALAPRDGERIVAARSACARLTELTEGEHGNPELIDCAVFVRRNVPELVATTQAVIVDADEAEKAELVEGLVADLVAIGQRAAAEMKRAGSPLRDKHTALRAHVARRVGGGEVAEPRGLLFDDPA
jgi:hypothetical protein